MKTILVTVSLALAGVSTAQAQIFRPSVGGSAVVGAVAGGLIGGHNGDRWAEGAVIGAAAGALIGAAITPREPVYTTPPPVYQAPASYGQQVYGQTVYSPQPGTTVVQAPTVSNAPTVADAPTIYQPGPTTVVQAPPHVVHTQPQVVYVETAPRVVYVPAPAPRVIYAAPPVVSFGFGIHSGPRYHYPRHHAHGYR